MPEHDEITSILKKHNYIVECVVDNLTVNCKYADIFSVSYSLNYIYSNIIGIEIKYNNNINNIFLYSWIVRWYIFLDIIRLCRRHKLSHNIIRFFDKDGNSGDLKDLLKIDIDTIHQKMESDISNYIVPILVNNNRINEFDDQLIENGIINVFNILKGLMV